MEDVTYTHPSDAGLARVHPTPLTEPLRELILAMKGRPQNYLPETYKQPARAHCESNCLLILEELSKRDGRIQARAAYGVALLPATWGEKETDRWRTHVWLVVENERHDPTYEIAWKKEDLTQVEYFEFSTRSLDDLPAHVRKSLADGWRTSVALNETRAELRALGIDACLDFDMKW